MGEVVGWFPEVEGFIAVLDRIEQGREQIGHEEYAKSIYRLDNEQAWAPGKVISFLFSCVPKKIDLGGGMRHETKRCY